jgi:hypothetical protein
MCVISIKNESHLAPSRSPSMPAVTGFRTLHKWSLPALETSHPLQTVSSSAIELFYWTTRRDYFSQCFRKDLGKFSTFSIGLLGEIIFPSVSGKTRTSFQLFLLDYSKRLFFQVFPERLGQVFNFFYWTPRRLQRVCISFRLQRVQRRGRLRLLSNPPEWTLTPFTRKLLFIVEKMESLGVSIVPASIVLEFLVVNGLCHRF